MGSCSSHSDSKSWLRYALFQLCQRSVRITEPYVIAGGIVYLLSNKLDQDGEKVVRDGMWVAEIRPLGIYLFNEETRALLKQEYDKSPFCRYWFFGLDSVLADLEFSS